MDLTKRAALMDEIRFFQSINDHMDSDQIENTIKGICKKYGITVPQFFDFHNEIKAAGNRQVYGESKRDRIRAEEKTFKRMRNNPHIDGDTVRDRLRKRLAAKK